MATETPKRCLWISLKLFCVHALIAAVFIISDLNLFFRTTTAKLLAYFVSLIILLWIGLFKVKKPIQKSTTTTSVYAYLQEFDEADIDLRKSPLGGWNAYYRNQLAYGVTKQRSPRKTLDNDDETGETLLSPSWDLGSDSSSVEDQKSWKNIFMSSLGRGWTSTYGRCHRMESMEPLERYLPRGAGAFNEIDDVDEIVFHYPSSSKDSTEEGSLMAIFPYHFGLVQQQSRQADNDIPEISIFRTNDTDESPIRYYSDLKSNQGREII